jgi:hypothetical protein
MGLGLSGTKRQLLIHSEMRRDIFLFSTQHQVSTVTMFFYHDTETVLKERVRRHAVLSGRGDRTVCSGRRV